jgi:hypothetical protein
MLNAPWRDNPFHLHGCPYCFTLYRCKLMPGYPIDMQRTFCDWGGLRACPSCWWEQQLVNTQYEAAANAEYWLTHKAKDLLCITPPSSISA